MQSWAEDELRTLELGDVRRARRLAAIVYTLARRPGMSLPQTFASKADLNAAYYAFNSEFTVPCAIRDAHKDATVERIRPHPLVIVPNDTTNLDFTDHDAVFGLGHLDGRNRLGLLAHTAIAVTPEGLMLGTLHQQVWARDLEAKGQNSARATRETGDKESQKWLTCLEAVQRAVPETTTAVLTGDRESDLYPLFAHEREPHVELLVRSAQNRRVEGEHRLLNDAVRAVLPCGTLTIDVRGADNRAARSAKLTLRYTSVSMLPPKNEPKSKGLQPVEVRVVLAEEEMPPEGAQPLRWLLLTTLPVASAGAAAQMVTYYSRRWTIERLHYVLKSGCRFEKLQLGTTEALETALAICNIVAWKLLNLTHLIRLTPEVPSDIVFERAEWEALCCYAAQSPRPPKKPPNVREAVRMVAKLGGFLGRKGDGEPGVKTIWQGLAVLASIVSMYAAMRGEKLARDTLQTFQER